MGRDVRNIATIDRALHRRQFVLDREPHKIHDDWVVVPLANGFTLSHCPELEVTRALDADGRQWIVLGNAFDLDNECRNETLGSLVRFQHRHMPQPIPLFDLLFRNKVTAKLLYPLRS